MTNQQQEMCEAVINNHLRRIHSICRFAVRDNSSARLDFEDLVSEVIVDICQHLDCVLAADNQAAYVATLARNTCQAMVRRERRTAEGNGSKAPRARGRG